MRRNGIRAAVVGLGAAGTLFFVACGGGGSTTTSPTTAAAASTAAVTTTAEVTTVVESTTTTEMPTTTAEPTTTAFSVKSLPGKLAFLAFGCGQPLSNEDLASLGTIQSVEDAKDAIGGMMNMTLQVCVMNPDGSDLRLVSDPNREASDPAWTPDNASLVFSDDRGEIVADPVGWETHRFKKGVDLYPSTSPDKRWYTFSRWGDSRFWIGAVDASKGSARKPVTSKGACCEFARWSPDSKYLIYNQYEGAGQTCLQLWKVNIDTLEETKLTGKGTPSESLGACVYPDSGRWSPDGSAILVEFDVRIEGEELSRPFLIDTDGGNPRPLLADDAFGDRSWVLGGIAWSPDGRALIVGAVTSSGVGNGAYIVTPDGKNVVPIAGTGISLATAAEFAWAPGY